MLIIGNQRSGNPRSRKQRTQAFLPGRLKAGRQAVVGFALSVGMGLGLVTVGLGSTACVEQEDDKPTAEDLKVIAENVLNVTPSPRFAVNADLDGKLQYLGLDVEPAPPLEPGKDVKLTHYWKYVASPGDGWKIFTHLEAPGGKNYVNVDHQPIHGKYPLGRWKVGQIVRDEQTVRVPASWPFVGSWRGGARLPVKAGAQDGSDRVLAATLEVKATAKPKVETRRYVARATEKPLKIDGKLDEKAWADAPWTEAFTNTMDGSPAPQKTQAKFLWDKKFLYVAFDNADTDAWSNLTKHDDKLWTQEADELMIDANGDGKGYIELQVAPNGTTFDTYLPTYRKYEDTLDPKAKPFSWNSKMQVKVVVDGTVNKRDDQDRGWVVEMAIPLEDVLGLEPKAATPKLPPSQGDVWRLNLFRMDMPQGKPQQAAGWSPPMVGDFHALAKFGELVFGDALGNAAAAPVVTDVKGTKGQGGRSGSAKGASKAGKADKPAASKVAPASAKSELVTPSQ
jgi:hypothetical protein